MTKDEIARMRRVVSDLHEWADDVSRSQTTDGVVVGAIMRRVARVMLYMDGAALVDMDENTARDFVRGVRMDLEPRRGRASTFSEVVDEVVAGLGRAD